MKPVFKKVPAYNNHFYHEANGDFRKDVTKIRISKNGRKWDIVIFKEGVLKGEHYCECASLKDAKETSDMHFGY